MKFHIPKQHKPTKERIDVRLEVAVLNELDLYCQYMESDREYVIGTVLRIVFKKDKGFVAWKREAKALVDASNDPARLPA